MTSRAVQLQPAVEQAHSRSEDALAQLARHQQALAAAELQLTELHRYRSEYASGSGSSASQSVGIARLARALDQSREAWRQAHAREAALGSVIKQCLERERQAGDRQEQAEVDERMQYRRRSR